jgi:hypothetical protein
VVDLENQVAVEPKQPLKPQAECLFGLAFPAQRVLAGETVMEVVVDPRQH